MDPEGQVQLAGWVGAALGAAIGLAGGMIGTYLAVRNTQGPRERAFVIKAAAVCWVLVTLFVVAMILIHSWYKHLLWIPFAIGLAVGIRWWNRHQAEIRNEEANQA